MEQESFNSIVSDIHNQSLAFKEKTLKEVYKKWTGNELTADNAKGVYLIITQGSPFREVVMIEGREVGAFETEFNGLSVLIKFTPLVKYV